jgi:hypothetical protein
MLWLYWTHKLYNRPPESFTSYLISNKWIMFLRIDLWVSANQITLLEAMLKPPLDSPLNNEDIFHSNGSVHVVQKIWHLVIHTLSDIKGHSVLYVMHLKYIDIMFVTSHQQVKKVFCKSKRNLHCIFWFSNTVSTFPAYSNRLN